MSNRTAWLSRAVLIVIIGAVVIAMLVFSISLLPAPPLAPTATWPQGIDLPDKLPRIPSG